MVQRSGICSYDAFRKTRFFSSLNSFRCVSVTAVIWHHTAGQDWPLPILNRGFLGVDMFFVISGFLIVTLLLRERDRNGRISLSKFYGRRTLRIFPVYYALLFTLSILFLLTRLDSATAGPFFAEFPYYLTYTANWIHCGTFMGISWSLASEEQFYLFWPPIERFLRAWSLPILGVALVVNQAINFRLFPLSERWYSLEILEITFTPILLGVLLAHILHRRKGFAYLTRFIGKAWSAPLFLLAMWACASYDGDIQGLPRLAIHLTMTLFLGACVCTERHLLRWVFTRPLLDRIGAISYGMYLYHMIARHGAIKFLSVAGQYSALLLFALTFLLTLALSELSFRYFEERFLAVKNRFVT